MCLDRCGLNMKSPVTPKMCYFRATSLETGDVDKPWVKLSST